MKALLKMSTMAEKSYSSYILPQKCTKNTFSARLTWRSQAGGYLRREIFPEGRAWVDFCVVLSIQMRSICFQEVTNEYLPSKNNPLKCQHKGQDEDGREGAQEAHLLT